MIIFIFLELGSSEESGKDWSDLEREAAEADKESNKFEDDFRNKKPMSSKERDRYDKHR